jgi:hypothetical protein
MNPILQPLHRFVVLFGDLRLDVGKLFTRRPSVLISRDRREARDRRHEKFIHLPLMTARFAADKYKS